MAGPLLIGAAIAMGAGALLSAKGQLDAGAAARRAGNAEGDLLEKNADRVEEMGEYTAFRHNMKVKKVLGAGRAAYAASGVTMSGSAMDVMRESAVEGERDRLTILYNARVKADTMRDQASIARYRGEAAQAAAQYKAAGTVLSGAGSIFGALG